MLTSCIPGLRILDIKPTSHHFLTTKTCSPGLSRYWLLVLLQEHLWCSLCDKRTSLCDFHEEVINKKLIWAFNKKINASAVYFPFCVRCINSMVTIITYEFVYDRFQFINYTYPNAETHIYLENSHRILLWKFDIC